MGVGEVVHAISGRFMHTAIYGKRRRWRSRFSDLSIQAGSLPFLAPVSSSSTDSFSPHQYDLFQSENFLLSRHASATIAVCIAPNPCGVRKVC